MPTVVNRTQHRRHVYVIDDDLRVRKSRHFPLSISGNARWRFVAAKDFLDQQSYLSPAPILIDLHPPRVNDLELLETLKERQVNWPVIIMSAYGDIRLAVRAMQLGAIEFLEKPFRPASLDRVLDIAFESVDRLKRSQQSRDDARGLLALLSPRESEILAILVEGVPNKEAAHRLALSTRTVEMHRRNALVKIRCKSIAEVIFLLVKADCLDNLGEHLSAPPKLIRSANADPGVH